jgi:hypothetical protein
MIGKEKLDEEKQKLMFGCRFEKLGQDKRAKILKVFKIINQETAEKNYIIQNGKAWIPAFAGMTE